MTVSCDKASGFTTIKMEKVANKDFLDFCYDLIGCRLVDVREIEVAPNKFVDMWFDEEFLLKEHDGFLAVTPIDEYGTQILGNFVFTTTNAEGATRSVPKALVPKVREWVLAHIRIGKVREY